MESSTAPRRATGAATLAEAFRLTAADRAGDVAIRTRGDEVTLTWERLRERVDALAGGLAGLGVAKGDTVALLLSNRPEFHVCDLAAVTLGATPFSIYQTFTPEQIGYVMGDAGARVLVTEQQHLERVLAARAGLPALEHVIVVDPPPAGAPAGVLALADVEAADPSFDAEAAAAAVGPDDLVTLIYTSGTTGPPKGVELTHRNLSGVVRSTEDLIEFPPDGRVISWLPAAHIAERNAHHYLPVYFGLQVTCCPNPRDIVAYLPEVRPSWFFAVPRIWEKLKAGLESMLEGVDDEDQKARIKRALDVSLRRVRAIQAGEEVPDELEREWERAEREVLATVRAMLGLDEIEACNAGAAPTPPEVIEFFHALGVPLAELWGMSETTGAGTCNPPDRIKIGTVGPPTPKVEAKLAEDGELLVRSDVVMT